MVWQDPMNDSQQMETRRRIRYVLQLLREEFERRSIPVRQEDNNTLVVRGMTLTASDQVSDTVNGVCYLLTDYNQMIECTDSRIGECADTILELTEVQVEKCSFSQMVSRLRRK